MTTSPQAGVRIVGSVRSADGRGTVRMEDVFGTDIDDLWSALTDPHRLARWLGQVEGDLRGGGEFRARFTSTWEGRGRVDVCEPPQRLLVTMSPGEEDETVIEAWLSAEGGRTVLVLEQRGLSPEDLAARGAGWQAHVENLASYLAGQEPSHWRSRWLELTPPYQDLAGNPIWQAERTSLMNFLQGQRRSVLAIIDGLDDDGARRVVVPSGWKPIGIIEHLAWAERFWFQRVLTGRAAPPPWQELREDHDPFVTEHPLGEVLDFYKSQCAISDEMLGRSALMARPSGKVPSAYAEELQTARDVLLHMIEETARHAGHLDLARELIDGRTGLGTR